MPILKYFNRAPVNIDMMKRLLFCSIPFSLLLMFTGSVIAQAVNDSVVDGVVAVVGANIVLKSEVEAQYLQYRMQGNIKGSAESVKCQIFENLLYQKLMLNQAQLDSAKVNDIQVEGEMDRRLRYLLSQAGSQEKLEEYYQKSMVEFKNEMRGIIKEQMMIEMTQQKITKDVTVTPSEVKAYYRKLPKDSIPEISSEYEIGMIVKYPILGDKEKDEVKAKLKNFKERIKNGDDFSTLAILYSEDPGSSKKGGELGLFKRGEMRTEFEAAAFKLKPGEVSDIVETEDGFHLIQMIERKGEYINVRHILMQPKYSLQSMSRAKSLLDSVSKLIQTKKILFAEAVTKYSDDPSKNNGGLIINNINGNSRFDASQLDPKIFLVIDKMKVEEISSTVIYKTDRGKDEFRIYYLKERTLPHKANPEQDYAKIQQWALDAKKMETIDEWVREKINKTYISIMEPYSKCEFQRSWHKK
jgi:peptidyl-prolyl cis-trans isomerase SurA